MIFQEINQEINPSYHPFQEASPYISPKNPSDHPFQEASPYISPKNPSYHPVSIVSRWFSMKQTIQRGKSPSSAPRYRVEQSPESSSDVRSLVVTVAYLVVAFKHHWKSVGIMLFPIYIYIYWLVVGPPLWKIWVRQLGWWNSQYMGK